MKSPITYYGGKMSMARMLAPYIPNHRMYVEPFFGGGALFFHKPKSDVEVINDINGEAINFYKVVQTNFKKLDVEIKNTLHSRELFNKAKLIYSNPELFDEVKRAAAFWSLANQGFASSLSSWGFSNNNSKEKTLANKRRNFTRDYAERLELTQIECNDALKVIKRCDSPDSFFYIDPPYFNSRQGHYEGYTESDFTELLKLLMNIEGKFLLSSYPSMVLDLFTATNHWSSDKFVKPIAVTNNTNKKKTEVLTYNYTPQHK